MRRLELSRRQILARGCPTLRFLKGGVFLCATELDRSAFVHCHRRKNPLGCFRAGFCVRFRSAFTLTDASRSPPKRATVSRQRDYLPLRRSARAKAPCRSTSTLCPCSCASFPQR